MCTVVIQIPQSIHLYSAFVSDVLPEIENCASKRHFSDKISKRLSFEFVLTFFESGCP